MKFIAQHLMPYAVPDVVESIGETDPLTALITFSNSNFDPATGVELYRRYCEELVHAVGHGFDGVSVNEHHQTAYGTMPNPNLMAAALIPRLPEGLIAILGNAISLHNPHEVAEQIAMLDMLSNGRIISGFVRGIGFEYYSSDVNPTESHGRFNEAHDLITKMWRDPGPFSWHGEYFHYEYLNLWPRPARPELPIWIPSQGSGETIEWTASRRYTYLQTFTVLDRVVGFTQEFRNAALRNGYVSGPEQLGWSLPLYVGETDKSAREEFKPHIEAFFNRLLTGPIPRWFPPGYLSEASASRVMGSRQDLFSRQNHTLEELEAKGMVLVGGPDSVTERLESALKRTGVGNFIPIVQVGTMTHEQTLGSIARFGDEVIPRLRHLNQTSEDVENGLASVPAAT